MLLCELIITGAHCVAYGKQDFNHINPCPSFGSL